MRGSANEPGIIPLAVHDLFRSIAEVIPMFHYLGDNLYSDYFVLCIAYNKSIVITFTIYYCAIVISYCMQLAQLRGKRQIIFSLWNPHIHISL